MINRILICAVASMLLFCLNANADKLTAHELFSQVQDLDEFSYITPEDLEHTEVRDWVIKSILRERLKKNSLFAPAASMSPTRMLSLDIPMNIKQRPEEKLTVGFELANNFVPNVNFDCLGANCDIDYTADHVARRYFVTYSNPVFDEETYEIEFQIAAIEIVGGHQSLDYFASDEFIRDFHDAIGSDQVRGDIPDNRDILSSFAENGREYGLEGGKLYLLPVRISLNKYKSLFQSSKNEIAINSGIHLNLPLDSDLGHAVDVGGSASIVWAHNFNENWKLYTASGFSFQMHDILGGNSYNPLLARDSRSGSKMGFISVDAEHTNDKGNRRCHLGVAIQLRDAHADYRDYTAESIAAANVHQQRLFFQTTETIVIGSGCEWNNKHAFEFQLLEDSQSPVCDELSSGKGVVASCGTTYAADIQYGLFYTYRWK